jgi:hypothetical protein
VSEPKYLNRALTWLGFNGRVLEEAQDSSNPVLERALPWHLRVESRRVLHDPRGRRRELVGRD